MRNKTFSRRIRANTGKKYTKKCDVRAKLLFFLLNLLLLNLLLLLLLCFFFLTFSLPSTSLDL